MLLAGVVVAALVLRLWGIAGEDLWIDEVISRDSAKRPLGVSLRWIALADVHPPGYVFLLAGWTALLSDGDLWLRALGLSAGLATVALVPFLMLRAGAGALQALAGGLLLAVHAGHVHYSQEVRSYPLLGLWALLLCWAASALLRSPGRRRAVVLALVAGVGLWLHHVAWILLFGLAFGAGALGKLDRGRTRWLGLGLAGGATAASPWVAVLLHQALGLPAGFSSHLRRLYSFDTFFRELGPWGGLPWDTAAAAGALLWICLLLLVWRSWGGSEVRAREVEPPPLSVPLLLMGAVSVGAAAILPAVLPATPLQEGLLARVMLPGCVLAALLPAGLAAAGATGRFLRLRFAGDRAEAEDADLLRVVTWALAGSVLLGSVAVATGRLGLPRNFLHLVPLAAVATGGGISWGPGLSRRAALLCAAGLVLVGLWSALGHSWQIQPRPAFREALLAARAAGARSAVVHSRFDEPAAQHGAELLGLPEGFVRPAGPVVRLGAEEALLLTRTRPCRPDAPMLEDMTDEMGRPVRPARISSMRGLCLVEPGEVEAPGDAP